MSHLDIFPLSRALPLFAWGLLSLLGDLNGGRVLADPPRTYPAGELGKVVQLGEAIVSKTATHPLSAPYVGNRLNCTSCHLDNGTHPQAASFLGVATAYPAWSPREGKVITLEDRILNCFQRSQNGTRPANGSDVSVAIASYITWLGTGEPLQMNAEGPHGPRRVPKLPANITAGNEARGRELYARRCADCHGTDGQGDADNPPVWGMESFNRGAGLSHNLQLAAWLKVAMPLDDTDLSDQEALDIATYINSHPRPEFEPQGKNGVGRSR